MVINYWRVGESSVSASRREPQCTEIEIQLEGKEQHDPILVRPRYLLYP